MSDLEVEPPVTSEPLPILRGGPETAFRLGGFGRDGDTLTGSMPVGPWLLGDDGQVPAGALGVLVDDVLGYALVAARPPGRWSVSAEITVDVLGPLPTDGSLHAEGTLAHRDVLGAFATGTVRDDRGHLVAVATQRGRFVPAPDGAVTSRPWAPVDGSEDVVGWLTRACSAPAALTVPDLLGNPLGNVHGGISLCLSDLVARQSVATSHPGLTTASVHITYTRAIPVGAELSYETVVRHPGRTLAVADVTGKVGDRPVTVARVVLHPGTV